MSTQANEKGKLRSILLSRREALPLEQRVAASAKICRHLALWLSQHEVEQVFTFQAFRLEPDLSGLPTLVPTLKMGWPVLGPEARTMAFYAPAADKPFRQGKFGIFEPDSTSSTLLALTPKTVVLVPCVAADLAKTRLGYGGGYYDRFLAAKKPFAAIGVVFSTFLVEALPHEAHDVRLDLIVSEAGLIL